MKIAMPIWENCVSTVLDFSETLLIVDIEGKEIKGESCVNWSLCNDTMKLSLMQEEGVTVLLCGAVSKPMQIMLESSGIDLISCLRGSKDMILQAYLAGNLHEDRFRLPGSSVKRCRKRSGICSDKKPTAQGPNRAPRV
jgi:predicted Fe-Mo cluster-binding NifX family protein